VKIFVSCDMEGVAGIVDWSQCRAGGEGYAVGRGLLTAEVNAAITGAVAGHADELLVNDSHGAMANLDPGALAEGATYLSGRHKPGYMMQGLDASFDAVFLVGYHGSISGPPSVLSHTYNPEVIAGARLNGAWVGESGINALACVAADAPVALLTGDQVTLDEARWFAPDTCTVQTKTSISRFAAHHLRPEESCRQIHQAARWAVERVAAGEIALPRIEGPYVLEVDLVTADMADVGCWVKGVEKSGPRTVRIESADPASVHDSFVALTYITRQAGGR
jgi:D-amino peptidase